MNLYRPVYSREDLSENMNSNKEKWAFHLNHETPRQFGKTGLPVNNSTEVENRKLLLTE